MAQPTVTTDSRGTETEKVLPSYSVPHAAILIGIGPLRLWEMVRENEIPSFTIDGRRLLSRRALDDYLAKHEANAEALAATASSRERPQ